MILDKLDLSHLKFSNFLKELDLLGKINNCNSLMIIDAINEAGDNKVWLNQLAGLLSEIKQYNNISIAFSVRDVEEYRVISETSESLVTKMTHQGIQELTFEQFDKFCKIFDIHTPDIPIMNKINYNPGLLLLFLESLEKLDLQYIDTDILSPSYIFENILKGANRRISQKKSLDEDAELSQQAIDFITQKFIHQEGKAILYKEAYQTLNEKHLGIELLDLISEGLLGTFTKNGTKYIFFTYQKLENYFIEPLLQLSNFPVELQLDQLKQLKAILTDRERLAKIINKDKFIQLRNLLLKNQLLGYTKDDAKILQQRILKK